MTQWERGESGTAGRHSIHFDLNSLKRDAGASLMGCLHQQQAEHKEGGMMERKTRKWRWFPATPLFFHTDHQFPVVSEETLKPLIIILVFEKEAGLLSGGLKVLRREVF